MKACENCKHWEGFDGVGLCYLNPPIYIGGDPEAIEAWRRPLTDASDYCSEHQPEAPLTE